MQLLLGDEEDDEGPVAGENSSLVSQQGAKATQMPNSDNRLRFNAMLEFLHNNEHHFISDGSKPTYYRSFLLSDRGEE